ncbi:hypothetical protein RBS60_19300 [Sinomonas sp. ASV486]|uniref:hypothetical protein n=1 Tax=Sinomonas sp. ASV486 TaxID=3051170 RepID=UPI0027DC3FF8|nr:hypothetical protein [Sinomonas sp. ASV486]MDQ4492348.1 hypothetical protein [Sinomonas sp. ASV486]
MRTIPTPPLPTLASAADWVEAAVLAGLRLEMAHTGRPIRLPRSSRVAARAILATAIDNAAQHADTSDAVALEIMWQPDGLTVRMVNVPGETAMGQIVRPGRGIATMMSLAHRAGGWLRAGLCADGFEVEAFLPRMPSRLTALLLPATHPAPGRRPPPHAALARSALGA